MVRNYHYQTQCVLKESRGACSWVLYTVIILYMVFGNLGASHTKIPQGVLSVVKKETAIAPISLKKPAVTVKKPGFFGRMKAKSVPAKKKLLALIMSVTNADQFIRLTKKLENKEITELEFMEAHAKLSRQVADKVIKVVSIACALGVGEVVRTKVVKHWTKPSVFKKTDLTVSEKIKRWFGAPPKKNHPLENLITTPAIRAQLEAIIRSISAPERKNTFKPSALFFGPPGTGKTLAAETIASETGAVFIEVSAADFERFTDPGERLEELERIFSYAEEQKRPYIIFFDEVEAMTQNRLSTRENKFLTKLLTLLSKPSQWFSFIAASNRPEQIDSALWNRMIYKIEFKLPDEKEREALLKLFFKKYAVEVVDDFDYKKAAQELNNMSARAIMSFVGKLPQLKTSDEKVTLQFFQDKYKQYQEVEDSLKRYQEEAVKERLRMAGVQVPASPSSK